MISDFFDETVHRKVQASSMSHNALFHFWDLENEERWKAISIITVVVVWESNWIIGPESRRYSITQRSHKLAGHLTVTIAFTRLASVPKFETLKNSQLNSIGISPLESSIDTHQSVNVRIKPPNNEINGAPLASFD